MTRRARRLPLRLLAARRAGRRSERRAAAAPPAATAAAAAETPAPARPPPDALRGADGGGDRRLPRRLLQPPRGVRLDLVFSPHVSFGGYVGYANLKGKDGRANNVLPYAQVEYMLGSPGGIRFPLRFASGYLPRNGPVVRLSTGFAFPLTPKIDLVTELLVPTIWMTRDQMLLSMDLALELLFGSDRRPRTSSSPGGTGSRSWFPRPGSGGREDRSPAR